MEKLHFEKLTPIRNADIKGYKEALDYVFKNDDIVNVALSGPYSAGKSSVIESYKSIHKEKKFIHISLAKFELSDVKEENKIKNEVTDKKDIDKNSYTNASITNLEGKILNQLIHQIDINNIPHTNFRTKQELNNKRILFTSILTVAFILLALYNYFYNYWSNFVAKLVIDNNNFEFLEITNSSTTLVISRLCIIGVLFYAIYNVLKAFKYNNILKRINIRGNEIEIFEKSQDSYFDKYLNEVLYIFDKSKADVFVFEDMDRYNANKIFQHLREINKLLYEKRIKNNNKPIRFFYLIRDDIFVSKDRTKFFDFIIPIVPVIDSSNSYNKFIEYFKKSNLIDKFDNHFLQGISLYVDDMRILLNIYNEFVIYYNRISYTEQDINKLLAIIIYKNIFPRDFSDTQLNKGFVSTIINSKEVISKNSIINIENEIKSKQELIKLCNKEYLKNIDELNNTFTRQGYNCQTYIDINNVNYKDRKPRIEIIQNNQLDEIEKDVENLKFKIHEIANKSVKELINRENIDKVFNISYKNFLGKENNFNELKSSIYFDLLKYLVRNGYIDETYEDYMSYFYPNSLTSAFMLLGVKLKNIDYETANKELFKEIYNNNLYQFNYENINLMLKNVFNTNNDEDVCHKNYSLIAENKESKLYEYVNENENINDYINLYLESCEDKIIDNYNSVLEILNNEIIEIQNKYKYILYLDTNIDLLKHVDDNSLWDNLLKNKLVFYSENNILEYYFNSGNKLNVVLINFINSNSRNWSFTNDKIDEIYGEESALKFYDSVIECNSINDIIYIDITTKIFYSYDNFNIKDLSLVKIKALIDNKTIKMTKENIINIRDNYNDILIYFVEININDYIYDVIDDERITYEELMTILNTDIDNEYKIKLISYFKSDMIQVDGKDYSEQVINYILENNFDSSELLFIIAKYDILPDETKNIIINLSIEYVDNIIVGGSRINNELFNKLIIDNILSIDNKLDLLINQIDTLSVSDCNNYFKQLGDSEYLKIFNGGYPKLVVTERNEKLLDKLARKNMFTEYKEDGNFFKISRNKRKSMTIHK